MWRYDTMSKKVLIIQTAFLGDVVLSTVIIENIAKEFRNDKIDFLLKKGNETLLINHPNINEIITWNKSSGKYLNWLKVLLKIRRKKYDLIINVQRYISTALFTILSGAGFTIGFDKNPLSVFFTKKVKYHLGSVNHPVHEIDRNLLLINPIVRNPEKTIRLYPSKEDVEKIKSFQSINYICIAPASVWLTKQFPVEKWIELIQNGNHSDMIYLLGSKDDFSLCEKIIYSLPGRKIVNLAGELTLLQSAALMQNALMNYVNDSSPMHLASAMNAPVTAIFCSTVPEFGFGPLSEKSRIVETKKKLHCRPCGMHGHKKCPENNFECATSINVNELILDEIKT
jgi:heptosyltransferase-2